MTSEKKSITKQPEPSQEQKEQMRKLAVINTNKKITLMFQTQTPMLQTIKKDELTNFIAHWPSIADQKHPGAKFVHDYARQVLKLIELCDKQEKVIKDFAEKQKNQAGKQNTEGE